MDTKDIIKSKVSEYRVSQSATADKVKEVQTLLSSNKKQQKAYDDIAPEVAMKKVMDYLMGDGNVCNPYEAEWDIDASRLKFMKVTGRTPGGQLITEECDEQFPVGHYLSTRFWRPLLESFYKKTQKGEDNDAITQTLSTAFGQQLKGGRKAIANKQGHGSTHPEVIAHDFERAKINTDSAQRAVEIRSFIEGYFNTFHEENFVPWGTKQATNEQSVAKQAMQLAEQYAQGKQIATTLGEGEQMSNETLDRVAHPEDYTSEGTKDQSKDT